MNKKDMKPNRIIQPIIFLGFVLLSLESNLASSEPASDGCLDKNVFRISRPIFPDDPKSALFPYSFRYIKRSEVADAPTIVYLPGGPGETSMDGDGSEYSENVNVVYTDPRGLGCNSNKNLEFPDKAFSTTYLASDVLAILSELKLKNYVIHGVSYGTLLGTVVAKRAEDGEALAPPRALFLEGVFGRAVHGEEAIDGFQIQWKKIRDRLTPEILEQLSLLDKEGKLLDLDPTAWASLIWLNLYAGSIPGQGNILEKNLSLLSNSATPAQKEALKQTIKTAVKFMNNEGSPDRKRLHNLISCQEMTDNAPEKLTLKNGRLASFGKDDCAGVVLSNPYDSAEHLVHVPVFYLQGENDPATPYWMARYHFDGQRAAKRFLIEVVDGGHATFNMSFKCNAATHQGNQRSASWLTIFNQGERNARFKFIKWWPEQSTSKANFL